MKLSYRGFEKICTEGNRTGYKCLIDQIKCRIHSLSLKCNKICSIRQLLYHIYLVIVDCQD